MDLVYEFSLFAGGQIRSFVGVKKEIRRNFSHNFGTIFRKKEIIWGLNIFLVYSDTRILFIFNIKFYLWVQKNLKKKEKTFHDYFIRNRLREKFGNNFSFFSITTGFRLWFSKSKIYWLQIKVSSWFQYIRKLDFKFSWYLDVFSCNPLVKIQRRIVCDAILYLKIYCTCKYVS